LEDKKVFIKDIVDHQEVETCFLVEDLRLGQTKNGKPYASLRLKDRTGRIEARVWDGAVEFADTFTDGDPIQVRGSSESFQGRLQIKIVEATKLDPATLDLAQFLSASPFDPDEMYQELFELIRTVRNPHLQGLLEDIFGDRELADRFRKAPAAKRFHHAYISGLLEHSLSVARTATAIAPLYPMLDRDLLLTGALIHDLGKIEEFDLGVSGDYTTEGRLLGHMILGLEILGTKLAARPDFPQDLARLLKHFIISHHGDYQFGSPKKPKILEALALNYLDELDAKLNGMADFIERHADSDTGWTDYNRLMERFFFRPDLREYITEEERASLSVGETGPVGPEPRALTENDLDQGQTQEPEIDSDQLSLLEE